MIIDGYELTKSKEEYLQHFKDRTWDELEIPQEVAAKVTEYFRRRGKSDGLLQAFALNCACLCDGNVYYVLNTLDHDRDVVLFLIEHIGGDVAAEVRYSRALTIQERIDHAREDGWPEEFYRSFWLEKPGFFTREQLLIVLREGKPSPRFYEIFTHGVGYADDQEVQDALWARYEGCPKNQKSLAAASVEWSYDNFLKIYDEGKSNRPLITSLGENSRLPFQLVQIILAQHHSFSIKAAIARNNRSPEVWEYMHQFSDKVTAEAKKNYHHGIKRNG